MEFLKWLHIISGIIALISGISLFNMFTGWEIIGNKKRIAGTLTTIFIVSGTISAKSWLMVQ